MIRNAPLIACLAFLSGEAVAQVGTAETIYHCKNGDAVREVTIARVDPASPVPCEVYDRKFRDGTPRKIYSAQFDHSYCVSKAAEYVKRLEKGFWSCEPEVLIAVANSQAAAAVITESAPETPSGSAEEVAGSAAVEEAGRVQSEAMPGDSGNERENSVSAAAPDRPESAAEAGIPAGERPEIPATSGTSTAVSAGENAKPAPAAGDDNDTIKAYLATTAEYSFAADDLGDAVFVDALDVVSRDVNGDGQAEIFVRLNHERYSAPTACPAWDLYSVSEWEFDEDTGIALEEDLAAGLGICEVVALDSRTSGYEDLLIRVNSIDGSLSVKLIKYYFGGYRVMEHHTYDEDADKTRIIRTTIEGDSSEGTESGKSGLITLFDNGIPVTF
ncbi:MAG: hypothetical protein OET16_10585 [Chromatiales bacterium]|nr:hypothetical protein [Chromatiales bacterium]MDH3932656.1 hypothetical protein [Chromatiales bacterium]